MTHPLEEDNGVLLCTIRSLVGVVSVSATP